jgi:FMN phosphatase YigB (HAD superfamily)
VAISHSLNWAEVDDVLLDMDGTLLDRHFDNFFFEEELPRRYAAKHGIPFDEALTKLLGLYRSVEGTLAWTDLQYWSRLLDMDLIAMTKEFDSLIRFHPDAKEFLSFLRTRKKRVSVLTNAHEAGIAIKVAKIGLDRHVDRIVSAFEVGHLKMRPEYWPACQRLLSFDPSRSLYIDDDEGCLTAARTHGLRHVYHRSKSSSQLPPHPSSQFPSIENFHVLMTR